MSPVDLKAVIDHLGHVRVPGRPRTEALIGRVHSPELLKEVVATDDLGRKVEAACREAHVAMIRLVAIREEFEIQQRGMWQKIATEVGEVGHGGHYSVNPDTGDVYELDFGDSEEPSVKDKHEYN